VTTYDRADSEKFIHQTHVDSLVERALNAIDKPEALMVEPEVTFTRLVERDRPMVEEVLARCERLAADNARDFVAAGAVRMLRNVLDATE
jgi:hypothetical protein